MLIDKHDLENSFTVDEFIQCDKDEITMGIIPIIIKKKTEVEKVPLLINHNEAIEFYIK